MIKANERTIHTLEVVMEKYLVRSGPDPPPPTGPAIPNHSGMSRSARQICGFCRNIWKTYCA